MLLQLFESIPDKRRGQGRMYKLEHVLFFSVLAVLSWAVSYRKIHTFIKEHFKFFSKKFNLKWKKTPSYSWIRKIIQWVDPIELEKAFREYSEYLADLKEWDYKFINLDGKTLRWSFDHFEDKKAVQVFSAFLTGKNIILAHEEIEWQKTNEIPVSQDLINNLGLVNCIFTSDAMHCQKKL